MPPPERAKRGLLMSVNPPDDVAASLGDTKTVQFNQAIRIASVVLGDAAKEVAARFTPGEWKFLAEVLENRSIEPEQPDPGSLLASYINRAFDLYGADLSTNKDAKATAVAEKLGQLGYLETWAVMVACQFYWKYGDEFPPATRWWELGPRHSFLSALIQKRRSTDKKNKK